MTTAAVATGETTALLFDNHWMQYLSSFLLILASWLLFGLCVLLSLALLELNHPAAVSALILGHALLLLFHHAAFYQMFSLSLSRILVTNRRILDNKQWLWFSDETIDVPLWKVRSLEVAKAGLVPHPNAVHQCIMAQLQGLQPAFGKSLANAASS